MCLHWFFWLGRFLMFSHIWTGLSRTRTTRNRDRWPGCVPIRWDYKHTLLQFFLLKVRTCVRFRHIELQSTGSNWRQRVSLTARFDLLRLRWNSIVASSTRHGDNAKSQSWVMVPVHFTGFMWIYLARIWFLISYIIQWLLADGSQLLAANSSSWTGINCYIWIRRVSLFSFFFCSKFITAKSVDGKEWDWSIFVCWENAMWVSAKSFDSFESFSEFLKYFNVSSFLSLSLSFSLSLFLSFSLSLYLSLSLSLSFSLSHFSISLVFLIKRGENKNKKK